ncbi:MAG: hypothetical protein ACOCSM_01145 [Bacillota bacterium]
MNSVFNQTRFKSLIKAARIFSIFAMWLFIVTTGAGLIAFVAGIFIPGDFLTFELSSMAVHQYFDVQLEAYLSEDILSNEVTLSSILLTGGLRALVGSVFLVGLFILLKRVFIQVETERPFSQEVIDSLRLVAFGFMAAGVVIPIFDYLFMQSIVNQVGDALHSSYNLNMGHVLIGTLIYILMRIFEYGGYLQTQYDETV